MSLIIQEFSYYYQLVLLLYIFQECLELDFYFSLSLAGMLSSGGIELSSIWKNI